MSTRKPAREARIVIRDGLARFCAFTGDEPTPAREGEYIIMREVLPDEPDLAPGLLKAIEILDEMHRPTWADELYAEAKRLGLLKGDE